MFLFAVFGATYEEFETAMNQQRNYQQENVLRLRGLPWTATNRDIIEFFKGEILIFFFFM